jgi:hypothetical protein
VVAVVRLRRRRRRGVRLWRRHCGSVRVGTGAGDVRRLGDLFSEKRYRCLHHDARRVQKAGSWRGAAGAQWCVFWGCSSSREKKRGCLLVCEGARECAPHERVAAAARRRRATKAAGAHTMRARAPAARHSADCAARKGVRATKTVCVKASGKGAINDARLRVCACARGWGRSF